MAARVLLRRRVAAPFMAATLVGGALFPSVALAEAPSHDYFNNKKPIYDDFETFLPPKSSKTPVPSPASDTIPPASSPDSLLLPEPKQHSPTPTDRLAVQIGKARLFLYRYATVTEDAVNNTIDAAFGLERSFTETVASLAPSRESGEKLMPGLVYVLVASMAGSIASRNRNIFLRASIPLAFGIGAGWLLIPVTMTNVSDLLWTYERRFPALADAHLKTKQGVQDAWRFARVHVDVGKNYVDDKVSDARDIVEGWVRKGK
ncbi:apolipo protein O-domain-containing protein [Annulohypoxylon maeteangense]|uniref:apolipo protein O-domain-containing protein n=1 Tax=Annulohypoxylon maeteangense TaxID=1927788 RepID=UPI002007CB7C|nr:apolipo protein O-domain-containing protein [Annulohypoxylon maeteangense]KAI0890531.1 apolipo protein O-domain-containing protein [Annulohypoxylon maeteangense]